METNLRNLPWTHLDARSCLVLLMLSHHTTSESESKCDWFSPCDITKDYVILFDEFQSMEDLWATQVFVSKLGRTLRSYSEDNRVAVGTFTEIISTIEDSQHRQRYAFEQVILDMDISPSPQSNLGAAVKLIETLLKSPHKFLSVLYIVTSRGKDDAEIAEILKSAEVISKFATNFSAYALGIGDKPRDDILAALTADLDGQSEGRVWKLPSVDNIEDLESRLVTKLLCDSDISVQNGFITLYAAENFAGNSTQFKPTDSCTQISNLLTTGKPKSVRNNGLCISLFYDSSCINYQETILENQNGKQKMVSYGSYAGNYARLCESAGPVDKRSDPISWYTGESQRGTEKKVAVVPYRTCVSLAEGERKEMQSIYPKNNCVILYDTLDCTPTNISQRVSRDLKDFDYMLIKKSVQSMMFCN